MCERSTRLPVDEDQEEQDEEQHVDPIVRKFKYERRSAASISSLQSPLSSLSAPTTKVAQDLDFETAQQQLYAHRSAFMAGLTGNNLELLTQHLKTQQQQQKQQQQQQAKSEDSSNRSAAALMGLVAAAEFGYMRNQHQQQQQQQHTTQQQQQQKQQLQQQQQHPDSTATDVALRSSSSTSSSYPGECEEKRSGRNFQVSRREVEFFMRYESEWKRS